ncbi:MFS transporter [Streptomyces sp. NPDC050636]|uniref:MFS transporter n=1 Tax=Streptomyces sp. NPDC050636 TaxID=3154510 RepID=UPI00342475D4
MSAGETVRTKETSADASVASAADVIGEPAADATATPARTGMGTAMSVALVTVLTSMPLFLVGATSTLLERDLAGGAGATGLLIAAYWSASLLGAFTSRRTDAPVSPETAIALASLATAVALTLGACGGGPGLVAGSVIGGFVYGYSQPHTNFLLIKDCAARVQGFAFGLKQAAVPTATLLGSVAVPALAVPYGWRAVFGVMAVGCLLYAVVALCTARTRPTVRRTVKASAPLPWNTQLVALALAGLCGATVGNSLGGFLIASLAHDGLTLSWASLLAAAGSAVNIAVRLAAGVVVDRRAREPRTLLWQLFAVGAVGTLLLGLGGPWAAAVGALLAFGGGWGWAGLLHYVAGASFPEQAAKATAFTQMGVSLGGAIGPMTFGFLAGRAGFDVAWLVLTGVGVLAMVLVAAAGGRPAR